ncbi:hypothetical protein OEIGOIKO_04338 [Streptomyces chrestomyceticus JCM 4735]|uniref:Uncharacterized protein n=1 Tax=Streptomyces chrestomyceticus JCM 4735 TaxID=1306181 RepID=A0A7U9KWA6_9ACTN|nr:hypothetical protein OEIGOIKO_04338 [Streptomyces chrestomyceticus JCM 4735]
MRCRLRSVRCEVVRAGLPKGSGRRQRTSATVKSRTSSISLYRPGAVTQAPGRAELLPLTDDGLPALLRISPDRAPFATALAEQLGGTADFRAVVEAVETLSRALDNLGY